MEHVTVFAGFGGQGLLFAGEALARAALSQGLEVLWLPSYGPEMRGGTANCTVICSDGPIGSPVVDHVDAAVVLNPPSLARFVPLVVPGGVVVVNATLVEASVERVDVRVLRVPATELARAAGGERLTSVVALGALVGALGSITLEAARASLHAMLGQRQPGLLECDLRAFAAGFEAATAPPRPPIALSDRGHPPRSIRSSPA